MPARVLKDRLRAVRRCIETTVCLCISGQLSIAQEHSSVPHAHLEAQAIQNPVRVDPESIAAGGRAYAKFCANCHGASGRGNGRLATGIAAYGPRPSDLVDDVWQHGSTDGEIFVVIRDGIGPDFHMNGFQRALQTDEIWNVVNYVRTLAISKR